MVLFESIVVARIANSFVLGVMMDRVLVWVWVQLLFSGVYWCSSCSGVSSSHSCHDTVFLADCFVNLGSGSSSSVSSCHSYHGTVFLADCFAGGCDECPLSLGVLRPISTINTGHKTASHSSIIGFIGLTFWTLWSYSLIATTIKYPLSVVWFCNLTMVNPARCFVIQYCRGLTNATSNKNFATSWKKTSSLSFVKYDFAEGKYSPEYDWRTSLSNVYMTLYASFFRFRNRRTCLFVIGWKHGNENN